MFKDCRRSSARVEALPQLRYPPVMNVPTVSAQTPPPGKSGARFKLAAIDLDGTLLGPDLKISPENLQALSALHDRKIELAIASGRHYLSVRLILQSLPEVQWTVSFQGGEVSDRDRKEILARHFMDPAQVGLTVDQATHLGLTPVVYGIDGIFTHLAGNENLA